MRAGDFYSHCARFRSRRIAQLAILDGRRYESLLGSVLDSALQGLGAWSTGFSPDEQPERRLAFRELGLSIGLSAVESLGEAVESGPGLPGRSRRRIEALLKYLPVRDAIERFWKDGGNRGSSTWVEHREINMVMLATSLAPDGFLSI